MELGLQVIVLGLGIVFAVLIVLIGSLNVMKLASVKKTEQISSNEDNEAAVSEENDERIIAVISAAVHQMMSTEYSESNLGFRVRSIKRLY